MEWQQREGAAEQRSESAAGPSGRKLTIAIEGCCHGELDNIYATLQHLERVEGKKIDLLICCGDFQAVRNPDDLETMACPPKYRSMQSFWKYYSGEAVAPFPTLFIGGNHEAAAHLWELYYGGWAAPNIFFMGFMGCVKFGGVRIAGLSGIYKSGDFRRGHHERLPYTDSSMRSIYHVRDFEVFRLMQIQKPVDVFLSHDWPLNVYFHGDTAALLARKKFLKSEVEQGVLGSPPNEQLLHTLRPRYWFSAHLHTKFAAVVEHGQGAPPTRFLALDKCLPGRDFLQLVELDGDGSEPVLAYDEEWLAILRSTHGLMNLGMQHRPLPGMGGLRKGPEPADVAFVREALKARGSAAIPANFVPTAPPFAPPQGGGRPPRGRMPMRHTRNPQTVELLDMLGLDYNLDHHAAPSSGSGHPGRAPITLGGAAGVGLGAGVPQPSAAAAAAAVANNPEELDLDLEEDDDGDAAAAGTAAPAPAPAPAPPQRGSLSAKLASLPPPKASAAAGAAGAAAASTAAAATAAAAKGPVVDVNENDPMFMPLDLPDV